ncbi:hypothetical protein Cgig2_014190 [Carnegiea gigantea]|uniref:Uncharacterized protein n=1 Tax=Carnegiea gigantea TaxID=171969 RepID=A0A9Q1JYN9_9CARY|nr:hypothetical protein Cgig2_014190 [Carnegiea gigantea]
MVAMFGLEGASRVGLVVMDTDNKSSVKDPDTHQNALDLHQDKEMDPSTQKSVDTKIQYISLLYEELLVHHDRHHYATSVRTRKESSGSMSSARPLPRFEYVPATSYEPFHWHASVVSHRHSEGVRDAPHADRHGRSRGENRVQSIGAEALHSHRPSHGWPAKSTTALTPYVMHS